MKIRQLFTITAFVLVPAFALAGQSPKQVIQDGVEKVSKVLKKNPKKGSPAAEAQKTELKKIIDGFLDYHELSRRSLGPHWKDRTPEEQKEFNKLLRELIEESYTGSISDNADFTMEYEEEEITDDGATATVITVASAKNSKGKTVSEDLTFQLYLKDRSWMIYDVEFGDVSLVRHYRGEFNRKIKKESYPALIKAMQTKLKEIKSGKLKVGKNKPKL